MWLALHGSRVTLRGSARGMTFARGVTVLSFFTGSLPSVMLYRKARFQEHLSWVRLPDYCFACFPETSACAWALETRSCISEPAGCLAMNALPRWEALQTEKGVWGANRGNGDHLSSTPSCHCTRHFINLCFLSARPQS